MRYGIFSDVHSNLEALSSVIAAYKKERIDKYFCVGDIVGYGANPIECISLIRNLSCVSVAGNHDVAAYDLSILPDFTENAAIAAQWTYKNIGQLEKDYLRLLKLTFEQDNFILVHSCLDKPEEFNYVHNVADVGKNFLLQKQQICFVGHSHVPGIFKTVNEDVGILHTSEVRLGEFSRYLINVGSVGQPRDGDNRASYCIYDSERGVFEIKRTDYNIRAAADKIISCGLPVGLAERLFVGQ